MKKVILLLILSVMVLLGSCADFLMPGVRVYDHESYQFSLTYTNQLSVLMQSGEISVIQADVSQIEVHVSNYVDAGGYSIGEGYLEGLSSFSYSTNNGILNLTHSLDAVDIDHWNIYGAGAKIAIRIPHGVSIQTQRVEATSGAIYYDSDASADSISLRTESGAVTCETIRSTELDIQAESGAIVLRDYRGNTLNLSGDSGAISLGNINADNLSANTSSGAIVAKNDQALSVDSVQATTKSGAIKLDMESLREMRISTDSGTIIANVISFTSAGQSSISSETGMITLEAGQEAVGDLWVTAGSGSGFIANSIDFEIEISSGINSFEGRNGSGANRIELSSKTGFITLND